MNQHRLISLIESVTNTGVGFVISLLSWIVLVHTGWFDINVTMTENLLITGYFTVISILRGYALRRAFVRFHEVLHARFT